MTVLVCSAMCGRFETLQAFRQMRFGTSGRFYGTFPGANIDIVVPDYGDTNGFLLGAAVPCRQSRTIRIHPPYVDTNGVRKASSVTADSSPGSPSRSSLASSRSVPQLRGSPFGLE